MRDRVAGESLAIPVEPRRPKYSAEARTDCLSPHQRLSSTIRHSIKSGWGNCVIPRGGTWHYGRRQPRLFVIPYPSKWINGLSFEQQQETINALRDVGWDLAGRDGRTVGIPLTLDQKTPILGGCRLCQNRASNLPLA